MTVTPTGAQVPLSGPAISGRSLEDIQRFHRLGLRIYGILARDLPAQAARLAQAAGSRLRRRHREELRQAALEELPVVYALYALERLAGDPRLSGPGDNELLRALLLPCFALSFAGLYERPADPLKHFLARVDWYLDGEKAAPATAFLQYLKMLLGDKLGRPERVAQHLEQVLLPELESRLELAFRYEQGQP